MIRFLSWLLPDPPRARVLFTDYERPARKAWETYSMYVERTCRPYLRQYGEQRWTEPTGDGAAVLDGGCYAMENEDDVKEAA